MVKIAYTGSCIVADDVLASNTRKNTGRGLPLIGEVAPVAPRLAVVGGGPSIAEHVETLRTFDGEIWAINGAFQWCRSHGIEATFYSVDPLPWLVDDCRVARRAILAAHCAPEVFADLKNAHIEIVHLGADGLVHGTTSASTSPMVAIQRGHRHVTFYGCESSSSATTHAYKECRVRASRLAVECGGQTFITSPQMLMQAEELSAIIAAAPSIFSECSGGLLRAMIASPEYDISAATRDVHQSIGLTA
jgi:3D (Asp-Asp-Asp) domain-containing protein